MSPIPNLGPADSWEKTILWKTLEESQKHDARIVATVLKIWMPEIETVLKFGGTSPTDFTLHDAQHSFRVAQRMLEIIPSDTVEGLSPYELAFLLLSAYLHDIGMTPELNKVSRHYDCLLSKESGSLTATELEEFQRWLDDDQEGATLPLCIGTPTSDQLRQGNRLIAHYCRHRHNDWGEEWIRNHAPKSFQDVITPLGTFGDWIDDLIRLCRSHHYGWDELKTESFNPRQVGNPGQVLHLRYLACVLRIADILEFDPERTPAVVLSHRDISPKSVIFWHKDHEVSPRLEDGRIILSARPATAWLHRAVDEMLDQIDTELGLCRALADDTHFEHCPGLVAEQPYRWTLSPAVHRDLKPKPDTFVYINSSFRPNTQKILQILSGTALYGDPLAAVRELIQNAFDAVRESIAYQRLRRPTPGNPALEIELGKMHRVELRLERRDDGYWLACTDSGIGMNKQIIENYLLVSGQSRRHDVADLERRCRKAGFATGRTGQFGIGVLSYFMIGDRMRIATRRAPDANDGEAHGWTFETDGIGSWGELRIRRNLDVGTRIELHINENQIGNPAGWYLDLLEYLSKNLVRIPCEFHLNSSIPNTNPFSAGPGWTRDESVYTGQVIRGMRHTENRDQTPNYLLSKEQQRDVEERDRRWEELRKMAQGWIKWHHQEGELSNGRGRYRFHVPYFELPGGPSLAFFDVESRVDELFFRPIGIGFAYFPPPELALSWKGMRVFYKSPGRKFSPIRPGILCEVDFHGDHVGSLAVNRMSLELSADGLDAIESIKDMETNFLHEFLENRPSVFAALNAFIANVETLSIAQPHWVKFVEVGSEFRACWGKVKYPAIDSRVFKYSKIPRKAIWKENDLSILPCVAGHRDNAHYDGVGWDFTSRPPHRLLCVAGSWRPQVAPVWEKNPWRPVDQEECPFLRSLFPPAWKSVAGVRFHFHQNTTWNRNHKVVRLITKEAWNWAVTNQRGGRDPLEFREEILRDPSHAASWMLRMLELAAKDVWSGLNDRDSEFLAKVWKTVFGASESTDECPGLGLWIEDPSDPGLRVVTHRTWDRYSILDKKDRLEVDRWMPDPGSEWTLTIQWDDSAPAKKSVPPSKSNKRGATKGKPRLKKQRTN